MLMQDIIFDSFEIPTASFTEEGYLKGSAVVAFPCVAEYKNIDGTSRYDYKPLDELTKKDFIESLKLKPITIEHPSNLVDAASAKSVTVGMTGENVEIKNDEVVVSFNITDKDAVNKIKSGIKELSLGCTVDLIEEQGTFKDKRYTHKQVNMLCNHLALTQKARLGRKTRIIHDSKNGEIVMQDEIKNVEDTQIMSEKIEHSLSDIDNIVNTKLKEELDKLNLDNLITEKLSEKLEIIQKANRVITADSSKSSRDIMLDVIKFKKPTVVLDSANDSYVRAIFDTVIEESMTSDNFKKALPKSVVLDSKEAGAECENFKKFIEHSRKPLDELYKKYI